VVISQTLPWFLAGIAIFGALLIISAVCVFRQRWSLALWPLTIALILSGVRWITNMQYVFPFTSSDLIGKSQPTLVLQFWQSQQFLLMLFVAICWLKIIGTVRSKR
jgi:hypothetical protein